MKIKATLARVALPAGLLLCLHPSVSSPTALVLGTLLGLTLGNPYRRTTSRWTPKLLALSIVGLGAGMDLGVVTRVGIEGLGYTLVGIVFTLLAGLFLGKVLGTDKETSTLVSAGTAICGGSAIAAVAASIRAREENVSVSLATIFLLNALGLVIFPWAGHYWHLTQMQFGLWSALAIHDTSSVVGATMQYGSEALRVGTTVKLARALWIVPVTFAIAATRGQTGKIKAKRPWFILGFIVMAALVTWVPALRGPGAWISMVAKRALIVTLFLIGTGLTRETLKKVGWAPLAQAVILWVVVALISLAAIRSGVI